MKDLPAKFEPAEEPKEVAIDQSQIIQPPKVEEEPEVSQEEKDKQTYLRELEAANLKDEQMIENLKYMFEVGYTNFLVNLSLLRRHNNDMIVAINALCNGMVSDSMFQ